MSKIIFFCLGEQRQVLSQSIKLFSRYRVKIFFNGLNTFIYLVFATFNQYLIDKSIVENCCRLIMKKYISWLFLPAKSSFHALASIISQGKVNKCNQINLENSCTITRVFFILLSHSTSNGVDNQLSYFESLRYRLGLVISADQIITWGSEPVSQPNALCYPWKTCIQADKDTYLTVFVCL